MSPESNELHRSRGLHGTCLLLVLSAIALAGCGIGSARKHPLELKVETLQRDKAEVARNLEQCQVDNERLRQQVKALAVLPKDSRENFYKLTSVRIATFTGFYDIDKDGRREKLLVYVQPIDVTGDVIKAAGTVHVQLWNLNSPNNQALLGEWQVQPGQLRKLWVGALVSDYRLPFDVSLTPELLAQPLTVKIAFTDYLTGEVFHDQIVIEPRPQ